MFPTNRPYLFGYVIEISGIFLGLKRNATFKATDSLENVQNLGYLPIQPQHLYNRIEKQLSLRPSASDVLTVARLMNTCLIVLTVIPTG